MYQFRNKGEKSWINKCSKWSDFEDNSIHIYRRKETVRYHLLNDPMVYNTFLPQEELAASAFSEGQEFLLTLHYRQTKLNSGAI